MTARKADRALTGPEIVAKYGSRMPTVDALGIALGTGLTKSYQIIKAGQVPFKAIRIPGTNRFVTPTKALLDFLDAAEDTPEPTDQGFGDPLVANGRTRR